MGCPQSKSKSKDPHPAAGNDFNSHTTKTRNDTVHPEAESPKIEPRKKPHAYNDDPHVKGNAVNVEADNQNTTSSDAVLGKGQTNIQSENLTSNETETNANITGDQSRAGSASVEAEHSFQRVFVPNEIADIATENKDLHSGTVDVDDVDIGQGVSEITLDNQTVEYTTANNDQEITLENNTIEDNKQSPGTVSVTKIEGAKSKTNGNDENIVADEPETTHVDTVTELQSNWDGPSAVRYVSNDKIVYGLPDNVPKPAPPKTKKEDLIKPTTFTIVDRLLDSAPDNAFNSVPKLANYLTGTAKKAELEAAGDDNDDGQNLPPPLPVTTKKTEIVTGPAMFQHVDEHARNTPESVRLSVYKLAAHLCSVATSDVEKVRAFYYWVCNNISYVYDKDKTLSDRLRFDAVSTLRQGQGSYVNLVAAFCREVSIPVVTIPGCSKGLRHNPDKQFSEAERNHSWNAVHINGEWRFIDCTWGSGYLDLNGKFHRHFDEFWFLTDPEVFAYDHYPSHPIWQLLHEPLSIDEFNKKPSLTEISRELGFQLKSHREPIVDFDNEVSVSFATETFPLSNITADLRNVDGEDVNEHRCMKRLDDKTFEIRVVPPRPGEYSLTLYGRAKDYRHAKYRKLMEYTLRCETTYENAVVFPNHSKAWGPEPNYAELGFADTIQTLSVFKSDNEELTIQLDQTKNVPVITELKPASDIKTELKGHTMITAVENAKFVHIRFPSSGYYRLDVYAEGESEKYEYAALFLLECTVTKLPKQFPKCNEDSISKHVCEIIEPKYLELPADTPVTFKIRSRGLKHVMVGIPTEEQYGARMQRLGELNKKDDIFSGEIKTPKEGEAVYLSGSGAPPNVFWSRIYEYITVKQ